MSHRKCNLYTSKICSSGDIRDGDWQKICLTGNLGFQEIKKIRGSRHSKSSNNIRNGLKDYVNSESGTVKSQLQYVRSTGTDE